MLHQFNLLQDRLSRIVNNEGGNSATFATGCEKLIRSCKRHNRNYLAGLVADLLYQFKAWDADISQGIIRA